MSDFINTVDVLGDDAVIDSIIDKSITEFKDNVVTQVGGGVFQGCTNLTEVDMPNVTKVAWLQPSGAWLNNSFKNCTALKSVNIPLLDTLGAAAFANTAIEKADFPLLVSTSVNCFESCQSLTSQSINLPKIPKLGSFFFRYDRGIVDVCFPSATTISVEAFAYCYSLLVVDLPKASSIELSFKHCYSLSAVLLREENVVCTLKGTDSFVNTPIASGTGYIYVPAALVDSYKSATNWSAFADQIRAIEDYTIDGTITGKFKRYAISYDLNHVVSSYSLPVAIESLNTTLSSLDGSNIESISVTMDGVDITDTVYNDGVINIPVLTGDVVITATARESGWKIYRPYGLPQEGNIPSDKIDVTAGQTVTISYYLTKKQGFVYDARGCGGSYLQSNKIVLNEETTISIVVPQDGYIAISDYYVRAKSSEETKGGFASLPNDIAYGRYIKVLIE